MLFLDTKTWSAPEHFIITYINNQQCRRKHKHCTYMIRRESKIIIERQNGINAKMNDVNVVRSPFDDVYVPKVTLSEFLIAKFSKFHDKPALISSKSGKQLTFADVIKNIVQVESDLKQFGVKGNEVVCLCITSCIEYIPLLLGISHTKAVCSTSNPTWTVDELEHHFSLNQVRYVIADDESREKVLSVTKKYSGIEKIFQPCWNNNNVRLALWREITSNVSTVREIIFHGNAQFLFSSSGTTGIPKAVMRTNQNIVTFLSAFSSNISRDKSMKMFSYDKSDIVLSVFPHFQIGGLIMSVLSALKEGATCIVLPHYRTQEFINCMKTYQPTVLIAPPPVCVFLTKSHVTNDLVVPSVRHVFVSAAPVGRELSEALCKKFSLDFIIEAYGMTETSLSHIMPISEKSKLKRGSCGVVIPNGLCKVVDPNDGRSLGPCEKGEICYKSAQVMAGYVNNIAATQELIDSDGDIGYYDEDHYFYIVDRIKEFIKVKAFQVAPAELEDILLSCPGVEDAAVVGVIDEYAGELPRAYVVKNPASVLSVGNIKTYVADRVAPYKRLDGGVEFVDEIPKSQNGKILRRLLREKARNDLSSRKTSKL